MKTKISVSALRRILVGSILLFATSQAMANFTGTSSGVFSNPTGPSGMITTGVGTSNFTWGDGTGFNSPSSSLSVSGGAFSTPAETPFVVGVLTYFNGTIATDTGADAVDMLITLNFTNPIGVSKVFTYNLGLINSPNGQGSDDLDADYVTIPTVANTTFTDGLDTYTLHLAFGNFSANSFGGPNEFRVHEGKSATADIIGTITTNLNGVPDNGSTLALLGLALVSIGYIRRKLAA
jgi:hypothetical protein